MSAHPLHSLFAPQSIAVIGASRTPGKVGHDVLQNIIDNGYAGSIIPVNPKADEILGKPAIPSVTAAAEQIDLAIITVPQPIVPTVLEECGQAGIPFVIIMTAGYRERGEEGAKEEQELLQIAKKHGIRIVGPNCLGLINAHHSLNASFASGLPEPGGIAMISQSGAMEVALLDWSYEERIGYSALLSVGNKADITEVELLEYFEQDPHTTAIAMYVEQIADGPAFMNAAARITRKKPIILLHPGASEEAQHAMTSHTGSIAGSEEALTAACQTVGITRVQDVQEFMDAVQLIDNAPALTTPEPRVAIITNAGGPGILATDAAAHYPELQLPTPTTELQEKIAPALPEAASLQNPIDILGDADITRYEAAVQAVIQSDEYDAAVVIVTPQAMTEEDAIATLCGAVQASEGKPVLACFMGGEDIASARTLLREQSIAHYPTPERALAAMGMAARLARQAAPSPLPQYCTTHNETKELGVDSSGIQLRTIDAEQIAQDFSIPVLASRLIASPSELSSITAFPVVMKPASRDIIHKSAAGAVVLNIQNQEQAAEAFAQVQSAVQAAQPGAEFEGVLVQPQLQSDDKHLELIIGMKRDPIFGPVIIVGIGGTSVEIWKDIAFGIAPLTPERARQQLYSIQAAQLLDGYDTEPVIQSMVALSECGLMYPQIESIDCNPFMLDRHPDNSYSVDIRMMLSDSN